MGKRKVRGTGKRPPRELPSYRPRTGGGTEVRCLGPGPEHRFLSPDPCRVRVCERCRQDVYGQHLGRRHDRAHVVHLGD